MKTKIQFLLLSVLSTAALATDSMAQFGALDSYKCICVQQKRDLNKEQVIPAAVLENLRANQKKRQVNINLEDSFSKLPFSASNAANLSKVASRADSLSIKKQQVNHVLEAVEAFVKKDIDSIFNVLNRPDIESDPVLANKNLDHLYGAMLPILCWKVKNETHPKNQRKPIPPKMKPGSKSDSPLLQSVVMKVPASRVPVATEASIFPQEEQPGLMARQKNRIFGVIKSLTAWAW